MNKERTNILCCEGYSCVCVIILFVVVRCLILKARQLDYYGPLAYFIMNMMNEKWYRKHSQFTQVIV